VLASNYDGHESPAAAALNKSGAGRVHRFVSIGFIVGGFIALLLVIGALTLWRVGRVSSEAAWARQTFGVIDNISDLRVAVRDAETGQRGYLLTGLPIYLAPYDAALKHLPVLYDSFRRMTANNPRQQQHVDTLAALVQQKLDELAETVRIRAEFGEDAAKIVVLQGVGRNLMVEISAGLDGMLAEERSQLAERFAEAGQTEGEIGWLSIMGAVSATSFVALAAFMLHRERLNRLVFVASLASSNLMLKEGIVEAMAAQDTARDRLEASHRLEALGQLAGGIAHDINNVLQTISGACSLMLARRRSHEDVERLSSMALTAANRGSAVARRLLVFASRGNLRTEEVDPTALLVDLQELLNHTLGGTIAVELDLTPGLPMILVDHLQLETIVVNLATNARDALPDGGIVTIAAKLETVSETGAYTAGLAAGNYVRLSVRDGGIGMDARTLVRSIEPFFTTKSAGQGTGLGLSMAKGFVNQSGGKLDIASEIGQGTTVTLWFPAPDRGIPVVAVPPPLNRLQPRDAASVLVVDDNQPARELLCERLIGSQFTIHQSASAVEALAALDGGLKIDLLLTVLSMPGRNGIELIRAARRYAPGLPAIILTGHAGAAATRAIEDAVGGECSVLQKPIRFDVLPDEIMNVVHRSRALPAV
jgi:signal transduction histidine kinase/ActR/RegA family two-component response regulator